MCPPYRVELGGWIEDGEVRVARLICVAGAVSVLEDDELARAGELHPPGVALSPERQGHRGVVRDLACLAEVLEGRPRVGDRALAPLVLAELADQDHGDVE